MHVLMHVLGVIHSAKGCNPFNQNFRAEVQKFRGVEWMVRAILFHSTRKTSFALILMENVGSLLLVLEPDDNFDGDINDIV